MPTFKAFRGGTEVGSLRGASPDALRELVEQHAGSRPVARDPAAELAARQAAQRAAMGTLLAVADKERVRAALTTIQKIAANILANPGDEKYRTLKVDNKAVKEKVLSCPGGREMLLSTGFVARNVGEIARPELLVLPGEADLAELGQLRSAVETVLTHLPAAAS